MRVIIPAGFSEASIIFGSSQLPNGAMTTLGLENQAGKTPGQIAANVVSAVTTHFLPVMGTALSIVAVRVKNGPNEDGPDATVSVALAGTGDTTPIIPNAAVIVRKFTALGGRKHRGRSYWPFVTEQMHTGGGQLLGAFVSDCTDAAQDVDSDLEAADLPPVLLHASAPGAPNRITGYSAEALMGTQRRRLRG